VIKRVRVLMTFANERTQLFSRKDEEIADLRMRLADIEQKHAPCSNIIGGLRNQAWAVTVAHAPCGAQIRELSEDIARLDKKLAVKQERAEALAKELTEQKCSAAEMEATLRQNIEEMVASLSKEKNDNVFLQDTLYCLTAERDKCRDLLAALRRQIKETKEAIEHDDSKLQDTKAKAEAQTMELKRQLQTRVKLASAPQPAARGRRVKLGASTPPPNGGKPTQLPLPAGAGSKLGDAGLAFGSMDVNSDGVLSKEEFKSKLRAMGWSIKDAEQCFAAMDGNGDGEISADEFAAFCQMEDKRLEVGTLSGIAKLQQEIATLKEAHQPCAATLADRDAEVEKLRNELKDVKTAHAPCDGRIKELEGTIVAQKQELGALHKAHAPCPDIIAGLKRDLDAAKAANAPCDAQIQDLTGNVASLKQELEVLRKTYASLEQGLQVLQKAHAPCPDIIACLQSELAAVKAAHAPYVAHVQDLKGTIASLKQELEAMRKAHAPCPSMIAGLKCDLDAAKAAHAG
jgi:chromosome segregation ATPase